MNKRRISMVISMVVAVVVGLGILGGISMWISAFSVLSGWGYVPSLLFVCAGLLVAAAGLIIIRGILEKGRRM